MFNSSSYIFMNPLVFERELPSTEFQTLRTWPLEFWLFNLEALFLVMTYKKSMILLNN